jgi:hypothetical protein
MASKSVYIAGPMTGLPNYNAEAFNAADDKLTSNGWVVVNPIKRDTETMGGVPENAKPGSPKWQECLRRDIMDILGVDAIHLLPGWERSKGATLEMMVAKELGVRFVDADGEPTDPADIRGPHESVLIEAERITNGPRRATYGHPKDNFATTAKMWSAILDRNVTAEEVGLCMIATKLAREKHVHTRDNLVDICGYANTTDMVIAARDPEMRAVEALRDRVS